MPQWVNPAVGSTSPLSDAGTGKALKGYGPRAPIVTPAGATAAFHTGIDVTGPAGTPVRSAGAGTVTYAGLAGSGLSAGRTGLCVIVAHDDGSGTYYGHLRSLSVRTGQRVAAGQLLGPMGATGRVTGPHLHFEVRPDARSVRTVDPLRWAAAHGLTLGTDPKEDDTVTLTPAEHAAIVRTEQLAAFVAEQLGHGQTAGPLWHVNRKLDLLLGRTAVDLDETAAARAIADALDDTLAARVATELARRLGNAPTS